MNMATGETERGLPLSANAEKRETVIEAVLENFPLPAMLAGQGGDILMKNGLARSVFQGKKIGEAVGEDAWRRAAGGGTRVSATIQGAGGATLTVTLIPAGNAVLVLLEEEGRERRSVPLEETAAAVAHEIRNPLGSMELFASMLERRLADGEEREMVRKIRNGLADIEKTVSGFLTYAAPQPPRLEPVDLAAAVGELYGFLAPMAESAGVALRAGVAPGLTALADARQLNRVFLNLALNSFQAMPEGGTISVRARAEGGGVTVEFADTGVGMDAETARRAFDPFFTTREKGTGLGLSIVHNIVAAHGGKISVGPAPGGGAVFTLWLKGI